MQRSTAKLLSKVSKYTTDAIFDNKDPLIFQCLTDFHITIRTLIHIVELYRQHLDPSRLKSHLIEFLAIRASNVVNKSLCYTLASNAITNEICDLIAKYCDPEKHVELLLPDVAPEDIFGNNINEVGIGNFILTDEGNQFICLESIVETAFARMNAAETEIYLTTTAEGLQRSLTSTELDKLGNLRDRLANIQKKMNAKDFWENWIKSNHNRFFTELKKLREGLRSGDVHHEGEELNAGKIANIAIVNFKNYYERLPPSKRKEVEAIGTGQENLGEIFKLLFRDPSKAKNDNGMSTIYCIAIIGRMLDSCIAKNHHILMGINLNRQDAIDSMKNELISDIKARHNIHLGRRQNTDLSLSQQKHDLIACMEETLSIHDAYSTCLKLFTRFVSNEIERRLTTNHYDLKCAHYITLLANIVFEAAILPCHRSMSLDNRLITLFNTISSISSATTSWTSFKKPTSMVMWEQFLEEHHLLNLYPFIYNNNSPINYIDDIKTKRMLKLPESYLKAVNQAEEMQDFKEWTEQHPISSVFLQHSEPIINFVAGVNTREMLQGYTKNPNRFFETNRGKMMAATAVVGVGVCWLISKMI